MLHGTALDLRLNFESSVPGSSCILRRTPQSINSRLWKDDWLGTTTAKAIEYTIRPSGALWRAAKSSSSRHHHAYSRHRWKKLRSRLIRQATAWTTTTGSQTTTFGTIFAITRLRFEPLSGAFTDHIAEGGLSDNTLQWLNASSGSARSLGGTQ